MTKGQNERSFYRQLTREVEAATTLRSFLTWVLGTLALVVAVNFMALWYLDHYPQNRTYWLVKKKWDLLHDLQAPVDWLILGDSSGNQGVVPDRLEELLGGEAVNLCTIGDMTLLDDAWMLGTYIDRFGPPENVVLVHVYDVWHRDEPPPVLLAQIPGNWGGWNDLSPRVDLGLREQVEALVARYLPLYAENRALQTALRSPSRLLQSEYYMTSDGYMPWVRSDPRQVIGDTYGHLKFVSSASPRISENNAAAFAEIVRMAEEHKINVYVFNSPVFEGLFRQEAFRRYLGNLQGRLESLAQRSAYVHFVSEMATFPADQMENADHVIAPAAESYTEMLARAIAEREGR